MTATVPPGTGTPDAVSSERTDTAHRKVAIIGSGPAGLTAAIYAGRANLEPIVKKRVRVWVDALNLLALRTPLGVIQNDGPFWGRPAAYRPPLRIVFGAQYLY